MRKNFCYFQGNLKFINLKVFLFILKMDKDEYWNLLLKNVVLSIVLPKQWIRIQKELLPFNDKHGLKKVFMQFFRTTYNDNAVFKSLIFSSFLSEINNIALQWFYISNLPVNKNTSRNGDLSSSNSLQFSRYYNFNNSGGCSRYCIITQERYIQFGIKNISKNS